MEIIIGLWNLLWTLIKGFFTTPGLNVLTITALTVGAIRLFVTSKWA